MSVRPKIRIRLLGVPSIDCDGAAVSVARRPLSTVLLAMIVTAGPDRRVSRESIAATLWPTVDEPAAAANLRRHLSYLLTGFPEAASFIGRDRGSLWCIAATAPSCDVVDFEAGDLDAYSADFMESFTHEWVLTRREHLRTLAIDRLMRLADTEREDDDYERAIATVRRANQIDPGNEAAAYLEIELHGERGDIAAVDRTYAELQRCLREIDTSPARATVALVDRFHSLARDAAARIPRPLTSYVETRDLATVVDLVPKHRLLTIAGPGGVGKTRLALEAAHRLASGFPDGAYFVDLHSVGEGDALADTLSRSLGAPADLASKGFSGICALLRNRRALVVLDNCEQIVESTAWFLNELLEAAPHVHVIATSRETFGLRAEQCHQLEPLSQSESERLFLDRAGSAAWTTGGLPATRSRVAAVCLRLDRLPLAIELAARMLGGLPLTAVEQQLDQGLDGLRSRDPTTPARHRSLDDVVSWSVSLLGERERDAFVKLGVFAGSFSAGAAKHVCSVDLASLGKLVTASILTRPDAVDSRFSFLNVIGNYAARKLEHDSRCAALRDAHAAYYADTAMRSRGADFWPSERAWLEEVDGDFPNFAQALQWSLFGAGVVENGLLLVRGLTQYFHRRGFFAEGASWLGTAIDRAEHESLDWARLLQHLARIETQRRHLELAYELVVRSRETLCARGSDEEAADVLNEEVALLLFLRRTADAKTVLERCLPLALRAGRPRTLGLVYSNLAYAASASGTAGARELYVRALRHFEEAGDENNIAYTLDAIAGHDYVAEHYDAASESLERALAIQRRIGDPAAVSRIVTDLGDVATMRGRPSLAHDCYAEALSIIEDREVLTAFPFLLCGIAWIAARAGRHRDAARLLGAARWGKYGLSTPANLRVREHVLAIVEDRLGKDECAHVVTASEEIPRKEALRMARSVLETCQAEP